MCFFFFLHRQREQGKLQIETKKRVSIAESGPYGYYFMYLESRVLLVYKFKNKSHNLLYFCMENKKT